MRAFDQEEKHIQEALSQIEVNPNRLAAQVKDRLQAGDEPAFESKNGILPQTKFNQRSRRRASRSIVIAAALCALLVITATAAELGSFDWLIQRFNPTFGDIVEPVEVACEDQGIRLEIIGAQKYENQAVVYLSLQDLTGQNRLTPETDFRDGFFAKMNASAASSGNADELVSSMSWRDTLLHFDEESNTAYFEFTIAADANSPLSDPLTLGSTLIYFEMVDFDHEPISLALNEQPVATVNAITPDYLIGMGGNLDQWDYEDVNFVLQPGYLADLSAEIDDKWISNAAYIDGQLHLQLTGLWNQEFGSSDMQLLLVGTSGEIIECDYSAYFLSDENHHLLRREEDDAYARATYKYSETVFTVIEDELSNYTLVFNGFSSRGTQGRWSVTASLGDISEEMISWTNETVVSGQLFEHLTLSPLGLQAIGSYETEECLASQLELTIETTDSLVDLGAGSGSQNSRSRTFQYHWTTETPLDVKTVTAIYIDGVQIPVQ